MPASEALPLSDEELRLLVELTANNVPFIVVGIGAAILQNADLVTQDLNLWFSSTSHPGVSEAAKKVGGIFIWRSDPPMFSGRGLDKIDAVFHCDGLEDFNAEYAGALEISLVPGLVLKVLPIERVLASKRAANRPKDRAVIPALEAAIAANKESTHG